MTENNHRRQLLNAIYKFTEINKLEKQPDFGAVAIEFIVPKNGEHQHYHWTEDNVNGCAQTCGTIKPKKGRVLHLWEEDDILNLAICVSKPFLES